MTLTREQELRVHVINVLKDAGYITCHPSNYTSEIDAAVIAFSAGRDAGLGEAVEVCRKQACTDAEDYNQVRLECADAIASLAIEQAVLLGEYSKSLDKDDPEMVEIIQLGQRLNSAITALKGKQ